MHIEGNCGARIPRFSMKSEYHFFRKRFAIFARKEILTTQEETIICSLFIQARMICLEQICVQKESAVFQNIVQCTWWKVIENTLGTY